MSTKRNNTEWRNLISEQEKSEKSQKAWCEEKGININTFTDRKCRQKKQEKIKNESVKWVKAEEKKAEKGLNLEIGVFRIKIDGESDLKLLENVCQMLVTLC